MHEFTLMLWCLLTDGRSGKNLYLSCYQSHPLLVYFLLKFVIFWSLSFSALGTVFFLCFTICPLYHSLFCRHKNFPISALMQLFIWATFVPFTVFYSLYSCWQQSVTEGVWNQMYQLLQILDLLTESLQVFNFVKYIKFNRWYSLVICSFAEKEK